MIREPNPMSREEIEEWIDKQRAEGCVPFVIDEIMRRMQKSRLPMPMIAGGKIWLATNLWEVIEGKIVSGNTFFLYVRMTWMAPDGEVSTNPWGENGVPTVFGPGFVLPHQLKLNIALTKMPTTQGGFATGVAPGVDEIYHAMAQEAILKQLTGLPWFGGATSVTVEEEASDEALDT